MNLEDFYEERMKELPAEMREGDLLKDRERALIGEFLERQKPDEEDLLFMSTLGFIEADFVEREMVEIPGRGRVSLRIFHDRMMVGQEGWLLELIYPAEMWTEEEVLQDLEENFDRLSASANSGVFADVVQEKQPAAQGRSGSFVRIRRDAGAINAKAVEKAKK